MVMKLSKIKEALLKDSTGQMAEVIRTIDINPKRPLGKLNPWAWWIEITRGCNLSCDFCPTRLFPKGEIQFMKKDIWISLLKVIQELTPYSRLEFGNAGEPTLHPDFLEYLSLARKICPDIQILTYTNGTLLINKKLTYKQLFDAGLNMIFLDMYAPFAEHKKLAEESGYYWYHQDRKPKDAPSIFTYQKNPDAHIIMLANNPYNWSKRKLGRGYLQTFLNDLDWKSAERFGLSPIIKAPNRRCDLPCKFVNVNYDGTYVFCCFDYMRHTVNEFGNIKNGLMDFFNFWLGQYMQDARKRLYYKNRNSHEYCSKCSFTSIRCDIPHWKPDRLNEYWDNAKWNKIKYEPEHKDKERVELKKPTPRPKTQSKLFFNIPKRKLRK